MTTESHKNKRYLETHLRFGIPSLDTLIGGAPLSVEAEPASGSTATDTDKNKKTVPVRHSNHFGVALTTRDESVTICIAGAAGVGKSILALHLASRYAADTWQEQPAIQERRKATAQKRRTSAQKLEAAAQSLKDTAPPDEVDLPLPMTREQHIAKQDADVRKQKIRTKERYAAALKKDADALEERTGPRIFYASTDLSISQARRQWHGFGLKIAGGYLNEEHSHDEHDGYKKTCWVERDPFWGLDDPIREPDYYEALRKDNTIVDLEVKTPETIPAVRFNEAPTKPIVHFLDLQANTAGDDWQFLNNLLGQLPATSNSAKHLLIIDAVEGLEALTGTQDAYGQYRSRRSRITQIIRNASKKCHLLFIIEGGLESDLPEQFAADVVLRLRNEISPEDYLRRTIEVEKARGQSHVRGQHLLHFRQGKSGSSTGAQDNYDDPSWPYSYVHVVHSLDLVERTAMQTRGKALPDPSKNRVAEFGIRYLDDMLRLPENSKEPSPPEGSDEKPRGLPCGSVTALTGDDGTQKNRLVRAFLARNFIGIVRHLADYLSGFRDPEKQKKWDEKQWEIIGIESTSLLKNLFNHKVHLTYSVYFTTHDIDVDALAKQASILLTRNGDRWRKVFSSENQGEPVENLLVELHECLVRHLKERIVVRRMERHSLSPAQLFHIVRSTIRDVETQIAEKLSTTLTEPTTWKEYYSNPDIRKQEIGWRIRVAIDDWQIIRDNYPEVRENDRYLGLQLFYLAREGVTTLIAQTAPGQPEALPDQEENRLQKEAHFNIRTWRIRFGDIDRVAITAIPPIATDRPGQIRELTWENDRIDASLTVDPVLELYQGLREGKPQLTPLRIRLNPESPEMVLFAARMEQLLMEKYPSADPADIKVLCSGLDVGGAAQSYESLRDLCHLRGDFPLDHSLVFMVDEFWSVADEGSPSSLGRMVEYLTEPTWRNNRQARFSDPDGIFQPTHLKHAPNAEYSRLDYFVSSNAEISKAPSRPLRDDFQKDKVLPPACEPQNIENIDRVPFMENFGFLLCQKRAWETASALDLKAIDRSRENKGKPERRLKVGDVWKELEKTSDPKKGRETPGNEPREKELFGDGKLSWRVFMEACMVVSQHWSTREYPVAAFELSRHSTESITCLFLEIWASEIYSDLLRTNDAAANQFAVNLKTRQWRQTPGKQGNQPGKRRTETESLVDWIVGDEDIRNDVLILQLEPKETAFYKSLIEGKKLPGYTHALYRSLLIMAEVLTWDALTRQENPFETRGMSPHRNRAVASRVWYTTASPLQGVLEEFRLPEHKLLPAFDEKDPLVLMELPGAFSTRGDWYLSVSPGSRSQRLAERSLDLMSSFSSNLKRLEVGAGLPTRDLERFRTVRTPLVNYKYDPHHKMEYPVQALYEDIIALRPNSPDTGFHSLWRSSLYDYDRQARVLQRWIIRELQYLIRLRQRRGAKWRSGFDIYDQLMQPHLDDKSRTQFGLTNTEGELLYEPNPDAKDTKATEENRQYYKDLDSWTRFAERCTALVSSLMGASRWQNEDH